MPEFVSRERESNLSLSLNKLNYNARHPYSTAGQVNARDYAAQIARLPSETGQEVMDMDPDSATYGVLLFLIDFDTPDDPTKVYR